MTLAEALEGFTEERFCVGHLALDAQGNEAHYGKSAVQWCTLGWFIKQGVSDDIRDQAQSIANLLGYDLISDANNDMGYQFVETLRNWEDQK